LKGNLLHTSDFVDTGLWFMVWYKQLSRGSKVGGTFAYGKSFCFLCVTFCLSWVLIILLTLLVTKYFGKTAYSRNYGRLPESVVEAQKMICFLKMKLFQRGEKGW